MKLFKKPPDDKEKISKIASQNCPKCNGSRKSTTIESGFKGNYASVNYGGTFRNMEWYKLYAIKCDDCDFVEIYTGSKY